MGTLFLFFAAAVPIVITAMAIAHPSRELLWGHRIVASWLQGKSPYRSRKTIHIEDVREPRSVRATAILTALLGGMIVPGGLAAIAGVIYAVATISEGRVPSNAEDITVFLIALSAPSGVVIAVRCLRLYTPMLNNAPGVARRMRSLAIHSGIHNVLLVMIYSAYALSPQAEPLQLLWATYPLVSLVHVGMLVSAARSIDRCERWTEEADDAIAEAPARGISAYETT